MITIITCNELASTSRHRRVVLLLKTMQELGGQRTVRGSRRARSPAACCRS